MENSLWLRQNDSDFLKNSPREYGMRGGAVNIPISRTSFENSPPGFVTSQLPSRFTARQRRKTFERLDELVKTKVLGHLIIAPNPEAASS
mmetsp:Transcript_12398/g.49743  ORF Transcript_12398/g.49743 Transcript_12398/m.49743 type:complete len:90 (-) Transcript_12398:69-338(-)